MLGYLCDFIRANRITDASPWIDTEIAQRIERAVEECGLQYLRPIYEKLDKEVEYDAIRIVVACLTSSTQG